MRILRNFFFNLTTNSLPLTSVFLATLYFLLAPFTSAQTGWSEDRRLVFMQGGGWAPRAACCGDTIHLVWWQRYANPSPHDEIFYKRSTDAGLTWGEDVRLSVEDDRSSVLPWIAVNGNYLHVVWQQQNIGICYRKSSDGGNSWLSIDTIPNAGSGNPSICAIDSNVYVIAYRSDGRVIFSKSTDNGNSWLPAQEVGMRNSAWARIKTLNQFVILVTCENLAISLEIYYKKSTDGGQTWSDSGCVSQYDSISSFHPAMTTDDSGALHIEWCDYKYSPYPWTGDIFYRASRDSGNTWEEIDSLTVMHRAVASDILAEGNNLHLVWEDDRNGFDDNFEIYYRMSTDLGKTWLPEERLTYAPYKSIGPSLACGGGYLHLFWRDCRDSLNNGIGFIYYKRKDLSIGIGERRQISASSVLNVNISPNPFKEKVMIGYMIGDFSIKIYDVLGKEVMFYGSAKDGGIIIDTKNLPGGVYFVMVRAGDGWVVKKVVKIE